VPTTRSSNGKPSSEWVNRSVEIEPGQVQLAFKDYPVQDLFPLIAEWTGKVVMPVNLIALQNKKITLLNDAPVERANALDLIFEAFRHNGVGVVERDDIILIGVIDELIPSRTMPVLRWDETEGAFVQDHKPKLQPACQLPATEGMEVSAKSVEATRAHAAVQEFLLLNHPVDCPICDQAGECKLQDYWLDHQHSLKRKRSEPVHKPKGVRFGPTIVYDAERCIMCTRCIRVCDELAGEHVLDMRERGNRNEIVLAPGKELDHRYTLMTEHVCPVGALTSRDFRFKARVWFLKSAPSVCPGCATGCNTHVDFDPRKQRVYRLRPRDNPEVNQFWMCDDGMLSYRRLYEDRVLSAALGRGESRQYTQAADVIASAATALHDAGVAPQAAAGMDAPAPSGLALVYSAHHTSEDNFALWALGQALGVQRHYMAAADGWQGDDILRSHDNNPNRAGVEAIAAGTRLGRVEDLLWDVVSGEVQSVIALASVVAASAERLAPLSALPTVVAVSTHHTAVTQAASHVLPAAAWAECDGSFTHQGGQSQRLARAVWPAPGLESGWRWVAALAKALGVALPFADLHSLRQAWTAHLAGRPANSVQPAQVEARRVSAGTPQ
ncbi:MAG: molybdopterin-dependent oxidoreductase, partial [Polyangiales bacterium]